MTRKRWTVLLVSHDSEAPRSITVSSWMLRAAAAVGLGLVLVLLTGLSVFIVQLLGQAPVTPRVSAAGRVSPEVESLRQRVAALRGVLDTIQREETQLRSAAGAPRTDSTTLLRRFFPGLPTVLGGGRRAVPKEARPRMGELPSVWQIPERAVVSDTSALRAAAQEAGASADSLATHASSMLDRMRRLAAASRVQGDSLVQRWTLRPESLGAALRGGGGSSGLKHEGDALQWRPQRTTAVTLGIDARITHVEEGPAGRWRLEWSGPAGLTGMLSGPVRPLVTQGERARRDQLILIAEPLTAGSSPFVLEFKRVGVPLDPATGRPIRQR